MSYSPSTSFHRRIVYQCAQFLGLHTATGEAKAILVRLPADLFALSRCGPPPFLSSLPQVGDRLTDTPPPSLSLTALPSELSTLRLLLNPLLHRPSNLRRGSSSCAARRAIPRPGARRPAQAKSRPTSVGRRRTSSVRPTTTLLGTASLVRSSPRSRRKGLGLSLGVRRLAPPGLEGRRG